MLEPRAVRTAFSSSEEPPTPVMITLSGAEDEIALLIVSDAALVCVCVASLSDLTLNRVLTPTRCFYATNIDFA